MLTQQIFVLPHPPQLYAPFLDEQASCELQTLAAYREALEAIAAEEPSTILFLQSMGGIFPDRLSFHLPEEGQYRVLPSFEEKDRFAVGFDGELSQQIQKSLHDYERPTAVLEESILSAAAAVFMTGYQSLQPKLPRVVCMGVSLEGSQRHYEYGSLIRRALQSDAEKIAVVCTGQLSHCLDKSSEAGYVKTAQAFNESVRDLLKEGDLQGLLNLDPFWISEVGEDLYRPLCTALGVLEAVQQPWQWQELLYEEHKGIGLLTGAIHSLATKKSS